MPNGITSLPGFPSGIPRELLGNLSSLTPISCGFLQAPVIVVATYRGRLVPVDGATVTFFYTGAAEIIAGELNLANAFYISAYTDSFGVAQACLGTGRFVRAAIQKTGINFGSGEGVQHTIGNVSGLTRGFSPYVFFIEALTRPPAPPCTGSIDLPNLSQVIGAFSAPTGISPTGIPALPSVPLLTVNTFVNNASQAIPIAILVDGRQVSTSVGNSSIDIISILRSLGPDALKSSHTMSIESRLQNCNIPNPPTITIPALQLPSVCTPGVTVYNPVTGRCEPLPPTCTPGVTVYNPVTGRCEPLPPTCTPGVTVYNPVTGKCEAVEGGLPGVTGKSVKIDTISQAYPGQEVTIIVTVLCGAKPSNGEWANLYVDGTLIDERRTSAGAVSFTWKAVAGTHGIMVDVPESDFCNRPGRDTKDINVSSQVPAIFEQLQREREAFTQSRAALEEQRRKIRELQLPYTVLPATPTTGIVQIPVFSAPPGTTVTIGGQTISPPTTGPIEVTLPPGNYTVVVQPPGGSPIQIPVTVPPTTIPIPITIPNLPTVPPPPTLGG